MGPWLVFGIISAVYAAILIVFTAWPCGIKDAALGRTLVITAVFCCWMMWAIVYISQVNPLPSVRPQFPGEE